MNTDSENAENYIEKNIKKVASKHISSDFGIVHLGAVSNEMKARDKKEEKDYIDDHNVALPIMKYGATDEEFEAWCRKEEEVLDDMKENSIIGIVKIIKRKKWWNDFFKLFRIPYQFDISKENQKFQSFLAEFFLRMHDHAVFNPVEYDIYRGMRSPEFSLNLEDYSKFYDQEIESKKRRESWLGRLRMKLRLKKVKFRQNECRW